MTKKAKRKGIRAFLESRSTNPIQTTAFLLIILFVIVIVLSLVYYRGRYSEYLGLLLAEAHGMVFDLIVIGLLLAWLYRTDEKRRRIQDYKEEIDDFRKWESEEAAFRTVGNIKRLNRNHIYNIDLSHSYLAKTNLNHVKLIGANLNYANFTNAFLIDVNLQGARLNQTILENCNMNQSVLNKAYASGAIFRDAYLIKSNFEDAFLIKANFENAFLMEANLRGSDLTEADFTNTNLYKADLRGAKGLKIGQLTKAKTLYLTQFDDTIAALLRKDYPELIGR
jgi:uncharacterized protein YjbI with pentapeptide repeats